MGSIVPVALSRSISRCLYHLASLRHGIQRVHPRSDLVLWISQSKKGSIIYHGFYLNFDSMLVRIKRGSDLDDWADLFKSTHPSHWLTIITVRK